MVKRFIQNYLSSGTDMSNNRLLRLKFIIVNSFTGIGVTFAILFSIFNLVRQYYPLGGLLITGSVLCIINIGVLRKTKNIELAGSVILFLMECLFVSLLLFGGTDRTGLFWFFTFPLLALFLKSTKQGFIWIGIEFVLLIAAGIISETHLFFTIPYTLYELSVLCTSLTAVTLIVFFYELIKDEFVRIDEKTRLNELAEKRRKEQFAIAEKIQALLIPQHEYKFNNLDISGFYKAAAGVGGDYFDYFELNKNRIAVIVSDVSGKGISGAFVMVNIRSIFHHNITHEKIDPAEMVKIINRKMIADSTDDIFATLSVFIFNSRNNTVSYCHAGFGPFVYYDPEKKAVVEIPFASLPAGVIPDVSKYTNRKIRLQPGSIIISFTDGLVESYEKKIMHGGKATLYEIIRKNAKKSTAEIRKLIIEAVSDFIDTPEQHDDICIVLSKIN